MAHPTIALQVPPLLLEQLDTEAKRSGRNRASVMRSAMRRGLDAQEAERAGNAPSCPTCDRVRAALEAQS